MNDDNRHESMSAGAVCSSAMQVETTAQVAVAVVTTLRFEATIEVSCCGAPCKLAGHLSLRSAGASATRLAYECTKCFKRIQLVDEWDEPSAEQLAIYDTTP